MSFATWLKRKRWVANVRRASYHRARMIGAGAIQRFDYALRPLIEGDLIAYPEAFYCIGIDDVCRAMLAGRYNLTWEEAEHLRKELDL